MTNKCPKCGSDNWDYACVGVPHAILCIDCGNVYSDGLKNWPFPCAEKPLTPWTDKEVKQYNEAKVQSVGDAMM